MAIVETVSLLQTVEWGHSYWWSVLWTGAANESPIPYSVPGGNFSTWFPASTIDEDIAVQESFTFHARGGAWKVPLRRGLTRQIRMTFYDDVNNTLLSWFDNWINGSGDTSPDSVRTAGIFDRYGTMVAPLASCIRQLQVNRLDASKNVPIGNTSRFYWVYPEGVITFHGNSSSEARVFSVTLVIVGGSNTSIAGA